MRLGEWRLDTVSGGAFRLDGGAMFGVVPKPLWEKALPADEQNRVPLATNCVLGRDGRHTVLIDTGYGPKLTDKEREIYAAEPGEPLLASLAMLGLQPADIDMVVFSHLHFDHTGGGVRFDDHDRLTPTFPQARYVVQRREWDDATGGADELKGSYPLDNLTPLADAEQLDLIDGDVEILPGLRDADLRPHRGPSVVGVFLRRPVGDLSWRPVPDGLPPAIAVVHGLRHPFVGDAPP